MTRGLVSLGLTLLLGCETPPPPVQLQTHVGDWRDEAIYQVVVDRFANGDRRNDTLDGIGPSPDDLERHQGGDWRGLRQRLDHVVDLGATAIWISPVVANVDRTPEEDGYHGYWASDFVRVNPRFGDLEELQRLVRAAHARDLRVIVDVVTNHAGRVFAYDLDGDGAIDEAEIEPPYAEPPIDAPLIFTHRPRLLLGGAPWTLEPEHFHRRGRGDLSDAVERELGDFPTGLRDLATEREDVREALIETYVRWVRETDVDGFRIDAVPHVEPAFWPAFGSELRRRLAREGKERFFLLGEVFSGDPAVLARYSDEEGALDGAFDFALKFTGVDGVILDGEAAATLRPVLEGAAGYRPVGHRAGLGISPWQARVAIADNHDTWRLRGELDSFAAARLALVLVTTVDAIPCVYYGTEYALRGMGGASSRERLWDEGFVREGEAYELVRALLHLRRDHVALRRGDLVVRYASEEDGFSDAGDAGILAYERRHEDERLVVAMNAHALKTSEATVPTGFAVGARLVDLLDGTTEASVGAGGELALTLGPREVRVLAIAP